MSQKLSPGQKCHQNWISPKTKMSPKLKFHQNWIVTKTECSSKLKCHQNWIVIKTEMLPNLIMSSKSKSKSKYERLALITLVLFSVIFILLFGNWGNLEVWQYSLWAPVHCTAQRRITWTGWPGGSLPSCWSTARCPWRSTAPPQSTPSLYLGTCTRRRLRSIFKTGPGPG